MTKIIKLPQLAWYETKELVLPLPDKWQVEIFNMAGYNRPAMNRNQIEQCLTNPIGAPPISELAKGKNEVAIIFDDIHRVTRVAEIVPVLLEELGKAGIPDSRVRFIAAAGTHAPMNRIDFAKKLGEATLARFPVYNHNAFDNCTYVGTTSRGTEVCLNAEVMNCDFKIAISSVTPHGFTVFSGGGKMVLPGVASIETIAANHTLPVAEAVKRNYDTNPVRLDMEEAAKLAGLDFIIECIVNQWGDTAALFAGSETSAHAASVQEARNHYLTAKAEDRDIVIANTYAKVSEASNGLAIAFPAVTKRGGDVVLIGNAPEGQVAHYLFGCWGTNLGGRLGRIQFPIPSHVNHLIVYTEYPDIAGRGYFGESAKVLFIDSWDDVLQVLKQFHGDNAKVAVYPNADIQYCA